MRQARKRETEIGRKGKELPGPSSLRCVCGYVPGFDVDVKSDGFCLGS
jgi:hypothetical protein